MDTVIDGYFSDAINLNPCRANTADNANAPQRKTVYVLRLQNEKYYVGITTNLQRRLDEHQQRSHNSSAWIKQHGPVVRVVETFENCDNFDEDKYTKLYMSRYGIENVRGGSYCQLVLSQQQLDLLKTELQSASGVCFNCGSKDHQAKNCHKSKVIDTPCAQSWLDTAKHFIGFLLSVSNSIERRSGSEYHTTRSKKVQCYNCGRYGHYANRCYFDKRK